MGAARVRVPLGRAGAESHSPGRGASSGLAVKQEKLMDLIRHQSMVAREDNMKEEKPTDTALLLHFAARARGHGFMVDVIRLYQAGGVVSPTTPSRNSTTSAMTGYPVCSSVACRARTSGTRAMWRTSRGTRAWTQPGSRT